MSKFRVFVDSFSGALGELPKKLHGDDAAVLAVLSEHPRFSVWDITPSLGSTLSRLQKAGRIVEDGSEQYPWCRMTVVPSPRTAEVTQ